MSAAMEMTSADANRRFSELLRAVRGGRDVVVTVHGKPVAKVVPFAQEQQQADRGRKALLARLAGERVQQVGRWTRASLYRDGE
jgi:prevent-host-death family protein